MLWCKIDCSGFWRPPRSGDIWFLRRCDRRHTCFAAGGGSCVCVAAMEIPLLRHTRGGRSKRLVRLITIWTHTWLALALLVSGVRTFSARGLGI
jgi:hypothetical protein